MENFKGILWQRDAYTDRLITIFRYAGMIGAVIVVLYGAAIQFNLFPAERFNYLAFLILSVFFLCAGILQLFDKKPHLLQALLRLTALHLLAMGFLLFVTGFQSPLAVFWLLLFVASYFYFDKRAFFGSVILLCITAVADLFFVTPLTASYITTNLSTVAALTFVGYVIVRLGYIQSQEHSAFAETRISESVQRDRMMSLINSMGDAIINTSADGTIVAYNAASLNLFDTNESLNGKKLDSMLELENQDGNTVHLFQEASERGSLMIREDLSYRFSDGDIMRLAINCSPVRTSYSSRTQSGYIFIMRDITKTKSLEEERDEFISVVSHELRTPIAIAEGTVSNARLLMERQASKKQVNAALQEAHDQTLYLAKMVNDLSTLSRAERGVAAEPEAIDIDQLVRSIYHEYQSQAAEKKLQLNIDIKGKIGSLTTSRLYLEEMLQNFMTNAIKYTQEGSVTLHAKRRNATTVEFAVEDSGIGISKSDQRKIFHKFYRSEDYRTRETSGTGLGLYVVKKLAERISARIHVSSRLNHGSTFTITVSDMEIPDKEEESENSNNITK